MADELLTTVRGESHAMDNAYIRGTIQQRVRDSIMLKRRMLNDDLVGTVADLTDVLIRCIAAGGKVILFGNGGSAADATHLAAEFVGRFAFDRAPMPALSLSDNGSSVTAIGNDYSYDHTFARQITALGSAGDVAIALSTSGRSPNVLNAMAAARARSMFVAAFTGARGEPMVNLADLGVLIPSVETARIQEAYMLYSHVMCEIVERELFGSGTQPDFA